MIFGVERVVMLGGGWYLAVDVRERAMVCFSSETHHVGTFNV